jgi:predicted nucleic acid-binding protein
LALARALSADLVLMDDRAGVAVAHQFGFAVTGTLGVLDLAARRGLIDLADEFPLPPGHPRRAAGAARQEGAVVPM